jgi:hypothetical protein
LIEKQEKDKAEYIKACDKKIEDAVKKIEEESKKREKELEEKYER